MAYWCRGTGYADWQDSTRPNAGHQFMHFYVMNITNPQGILNGEKPVLQEVSSCSLPAQTHLSRSWAVHCSPEGVSPCRSLPCAFVAVCDVLAADWAAGVRADRVQLQRVVHARPDGDAVRPEFGDFQ